MKNNFKFWLFILIILGGYYFAFESKLPGKILMHNENIYTEGRVYERVWNAYDKLPENIKDMLEEEKYEIYVVDELSSDMEGYITLGRTYFGFRVIQISNIDLYVERTTLHEVGHVIDDELAVKYISNSDEFKDIYLDEKDDFQVSNNHEYFTSSELEYFASAFAEYMINPDRLKTFTPRTYEFIKNCVNNI